MAQSAIRYLLASLMKHSHWPFWWDEPAGSKYNNKQKGPNAMFGYAREIHDVYLPLLNRHICAELKHLLVELCKSLFAPHRPDWRPWFHCVDEAAPPAPAAMWKDHRLVPGPDESAASVGVRVAQMDDVWEGTASALNAMHRLLTAPAVGCITVPLHELTDDQRDALGKPRSSVVDEEGDDNDVAELVSPTVDGAWTSICDVSQPGPRCPDVP